MRVWSPRDRTRRATHPSRDMTARARECGAAVLGAASSSRAREGRGRRARDDMNMQGQPVRVRRRASRGARERRASGDDGVELTFEPDERRRRRSRRRDARRRETDEDDDDDDATRRSSRRAQLDIPEDGVVNAEEQELARERQRENEERRGAALASVLEPAARERRAYSSRDRRERLRSRRARVSAK